MSEEDSPRAAVAVLRQALDRCQRLLEQPNYEEADLREALYWLKLAFGMAEPTFIIEGTAVNHPLLTEGMRLMGALMKPLKAKNPALTNWERAVDPRYAVVTWTGRQGAPPVRDFDTVGVRRNFEAEKDRLLHALTPSEDAEGTARPLRDLEEGQPREEVQTGTVRRSPVPPPRAQSATEEPGWSWAPRHADFSVPPPQVQSATEAPRPGDFLMRKSDGERLASGSLETGTRMYQGYTRAGETSDEYYSAPTRRHQVRGHRETRYGHQDDDIEFFSQQFVAAQDALQELDLGDHYRYPSDRAFKRYFPYCDFQKAMKTGGLPKFDGTVRGYPGFRSNFYNMVYVQREHYLAKLLALEYMVPEKIKQTLFHGLQNTIQDFGHRLTRLEEEFGGSERQVQYIVDLLDKARKRSTRLPYMELRELVREVRAHLDRTDATVGDAEMLVIMLKVLVPPHIKAQFSTRMMMLRRPPTGNNSLWYLQNELTEEIKALETDPHRQQPAVNKETPNKEWEDKAMVKSPKVLGCFYHSQKTKSGVQSESKAADKTCEKGTKGKQEWPLCPCCQKGNHGLHNCRKFFLIFNLREKVAFAKQQKVCSKCLRGDHDLRGCPFRRKADCRFCASQEHHYLLCPGGNEVILAAAGKATKAMPKLILNDKNGALTIHGNVGMVSGHKVSVKKVVKPQGKVNSLSSLKEKELRASSGLRSHKRDCQGLQSKGKISDDHSIPKAACVVQRKRPPCPCCQGNHELHNCHKFFLIFNVKEKVAFAKQQKICSKCLRGDHGLQSCPFQSKPDCRFCASQDHHYLLCTAGLKLTL